MKKLLPKNWRRFLLHRLIWLCSIVVIFICIGIITSKAVSPLLNRYRPDIEKTLSKQLGVSVHVDRIKLSWHGINPSIRLIGVHIKNWVDVNRSDFVLDVFHSIKNEQWTTELIDFSGIKANVFWNEKQHVLTFNGKKIDLNRSSKNDAQNNINDFLAILVAQQRITFHDIQLNIKTSSLAYPVIVKKVVLKNNSKKNHTLFVKMNWLHHRGWIHVLLHIRGFGSSVSDYHVAAYVNAHHTRLASWLQFLQERNIHISNGIGDIQLWFNGRLNHLDSVSSRWFLYNVSFSRMHVSKKSQDDVHWLSCRGEATWKKYDNGWLTQIQKFRLITQHHVWPTSQVTVEKKQDVNTGEEQYIGTLSYAYLSDVSDVLKNIQVLPSRIEKKLLSHSIEGGIQKLKFFVGLDKSHHVNAYQAQGLFDAIGLTSKAGSPSIHNIDGKFNFDQKQGQIQLNGSHVLVEFPNIFSHSLDFSRLDSKVTWLSQSNKTNIHIESLTLANAVLKLTGKGDFAWNPKDDWSSNFNSQFTFSSPKEVVNYLPDHKINPKTIAWLHDALLGGDSVTGQVVLKGKLNDFPFEHASSHGLFQVQAFLSHTDFQFSPKWPIIKNLNGKIVFQGNQMKLDVEHAQFDQIPLDNLSATLPDISGDVPVVVNVRDNIQQSADKIFSFIHHTPLSESVGNALSPIRLKGLVNVDLGLSIPVDDPEKTHLNGNILLNNNELTLPEWNIPMDDVKGTIGFTENTLSAKQVTAMLWGYPVTAVINTKNAVASIDAKTHVRVAQLKKQYSWLQQVRIKGLMPLKINLSFPMDAAKKIRSSLLFTSNLKGVVLDYPSPIGKTASQKTRFTMHIGFGLDQPVSMLIGYNHFIHSLLVFRSTNNQSSFYGGIIHFGSGSIDTVKQSGVMVNGIIPYFDWSQWKPYVADWQSTSSKQDASRVSVGQNKMAQWLHSVSVQIGTLKVFGMQTKAMTLSLTPDVSAWNIGLQNSSISGSISLPFQPSSKQQIVARFKKLDIPDIAHSQQDQTSVNPNDLPSFLLEADSFQYDQYHLSGVTLDAHRISYGLGGTLTLNNAPIIGRLDWSWTQGLAKTAATHFSGTLQTPSLTDLLKQWGVRSSILADQAKITGDVSWAGAPWSFDTKKLNGQVYADAKNGWLVDLGESTTEKLNLGKMLTLLSVRRLMFKVNDLERNGYSFDDAHAHLVFDNGVIHTKDLLTKGAVADIHAHGAINCVQKTLDLELGVVVNATSSLPIIATIASGFNPIVGVATWVADKVVHKAVSKIVHYGYQLKGPWHDPQVIDVNKNKTN